MHYYWLFIGYNCSVQFLSLCIRYGVVGLQGTVLDRIDYNVEQTATHVEKGLGQLQKAEKHQKKNRKMLVISVLFIIVVILLIILIAVKS